MCLSHYQLLASWLWYGKKSAELIEVEKSTLSAFASLAAGIAGGLTGGNTQDALNAAQAGKTTVENNWLAVPAPVLPPVAGNSTSGLTGVTGNNDDWKSGGGGCEGTREQCAVRDGTRDGTRGPGHVMNGDGSEENGKLNIGKDLTDSEKAELGGSGSGTPGGWGLRMKRMRGKMIIILIVSRKMISFLQLMNQLMNMAYLLRAGYGRNMLVGLAVFLNH